MALGALALLLWVGGRAAPPRLASGLLLLVLGWAALQTSFGLSADPDESWAAITRLATYAALFHAAAAIGRDARRTGFILRASALWITALSAYGLAAWATGVNPVIAGVEAYPRALESTFVNPNAFALYGGFGLIACLATTMDKRAWRLGHLVRGGWIWPVCIAVILTALVATGSRGGIFATMCGLGVFLLTRLGRRAAFAAVALASFGAVMALFLTLGAPKALDGFEADRLAVHAEVVSAIFKAPLTGHGFGAFQDAFRPNVTAWRWGDWDHAHQMYLETAFELGLPAATLLFAAIALIALPIWRRARRRLSPALALGALTAAAVHSLVDFSLAIPSVAAALAVYLGLAWAGTAR